MNNEVKAILQKIWQDERAKFEITEDHPKSILLSAAFCMTISSYYSEEFLIANGGKSYLIEKHDLAIKSTGSLLAKAIHSNYLTVFNEITKLYIDGAEKNTLILNLETLEKTNNFHGLLNNPNYSVDGFDLYDFIEAKSKPIENNDVGGLLGHLQKLYPPIYADENANQECKDKASDKNSTTLTWQSSAIQIAKEILKAQPKITIEKLAGKVNDQMTENHLNGFVNMAGRGGKVPSAETIKRHALKGIKK